MVIIVLCIFSNTKAQNIDFDYNKISKISDSIKVQNITIHNLFKSQVIAHRNSAFDSTMIVKNVYLPHKNYGTAVMLKFLEMKMQIASIIKKE